MTNRTLRQAFLAALLVASCFAAPGSADPIDFGTFRIYLRGRAMGNETFTIDQFADSVVVESNVRQTILTPTGEDSLIKNATLFVSAFDLDLRFYHSAQTLGANKVVRGLVMSDTAFTSYREENEHGQGDVLVRPPGRIYLHDPDVYSLFDVISRNLHRQQFTSRPITLMVLGPRDTTVEITATRLANDPLHWGTHTVQASRLVLDDGSNQILMWSDARGRLLQLEEPASGLRVVRVPPAAKPVRRRRS
jgi:hypothetical protein